MSGTMPNMQNVIATVKNTVFQESDGRYICEALGELADELEATRGWADAHTENEVIADLRNAELTLSKAL